MSENIAFIGVGNMGNPMACNLKNAGKKVKVFDVSKEMIDKAIENNLDVEKDFGKLINSETSVVITIVITTDVSLLISFPKSFSTSRLFSMALSIISLETSKTLTFLPAFFKLQAIGFPILPTPIKAIFSLIWHPLYLVIFSTNLLTNGATKVVATNATGKLIDQALKNLL